MTLSKSRDEGALPGNMGIEALSGFVGFFCATLAIAILTANLLDATPLYINDQPPPGLATFTPLLFLLTLLLVLISAWMANDLLIITKSRRTVKIVALPLSLVGSVLISIFGFNIPVIILIALPIGIFTLLYGIYLSTLNHRILVCYLAFTIVLTGVFLVGIFQINNPITTFLSALLFLFAWILLPTFTRDITDLPNLVTANLSKEHRKQGRGNRYTLFIVGCIFGSGLALPHYTNDIPVGLLALTLGACLCLSGAVFLISQQFFDNRLSDIAKRILTLTMSAPLLLFSFMGNSGQIACLCLIFVAGTINLLFIIDAVAETSRFNQISPFYLIGLEGAALLMGAICTLILISFSFWFSRQIWFAAIVLTVLGSLIQIQINNQHYPLFPQVSKLSVREPLSGSPLEEQTALINETCNNDEDINSSAFWHIKIDSISSNYNLSQRQKEILELLAKGRNTSYITKHFFISRSTAKTHIYNLYRKINIHSREELLNLIEQPIDNNLPTRDKD
ncbi:MAG: helix-turn-helix transcriptional regulator [Coriobacteriales bacterium]|nr:helix-turn-helix transcriptional regulator [Coriobacteriales bacterium]